MNRLPSLPAAVFGYLASSLYLTGLGYVYNANGRPVSAAIVGVAALATGAPVVRAGRSVRLRTRRGRA